MITNSRYDFMTEGNTYDDVSLSYYPDPLSLNYLNLKMSNVPQKNVMTDSKIAFFWKEAENIYGTPSWDDMVLTLNGVPHKNFLRQGQIIYFPGISDMKNSFSKERG